MSKSKDKDENPMAGFHIEQDVNKIGMQHIGPVDTEKYEPKIDMQEGETTVTTITIENKYIENMPKEYADSLQKFAKLVNDKLKEESPELARGAPIQANELQTRVNELAEETTKVKEGVDEEKKKGIRNKLYGVAKALVKMSPKIARVIIGFTPLAPFGDLIGETFDSMVQGALS
jgi:hypothetical protein